MVTLKSFGRGMVLVPVIIAILLVILLFIMITPSKANQLSIQQDRSTQHLTMKKWVTECVDCGKRFYELTNQSMKLDSGGNPHIAYGGDHLYYTWFDGEIWQYETVDNAPGVGGSAALALDQSGKPHISYHDRLNQALKYAYRDADGWHSMIIDNNRGDTGIFTSITLDENDQPHITYYDVYHRMLRYAHFTGTVWQINDIDRGGIYSNVALDTTGTPHISYQNIDTGVLKYAYLSQTGWTTETLDSTANATSFTSLVLDDNNYPHIGYFDEINGTLKYAFQDENGWTFQNLGDGLNAGYYLSLDISPAGIPWMSYYDSSNGDLKVGYLQGSTWFSSTVDTTGNVGGFTSLQFNDQGIAYVTYAELFCVDTACGAVTLKLAQQSGSDWLIQTVDQCSRAGGFTSLNMDSTGNLHLGYVFQEGSDLRLGYAIRQEDAWLVSDLEGTGELGVVPQPTMVLNSQGKPRFSYTLSSGSPVDGFTPTGVIYAEQGITNLITETVDAGTSNGMHSSLALDGEDFPHISYYDGGNLLLKYASRDSLGWHTETVTATNLTTDTVYTHLELDSQGYPHIVYNNAGLRFAYQDQNGWHFALVDNSLDVHASALALDSSGVAHIAYVESISNTLNYAYQDQGAWITEDISGVKTDSFISLKLDANDVPYIAFYGLLDGDMMLTHRTGTGWTNEIVDRNGDVGKFASLIVAEDGSMDISYYDVTNSDLRVARLIEVNISLIPILFK
jgi:hypothetical protein